MATAGIPSIQRRSWSNAAPKMAPAAANLVTSRADSRRARSANVPSGAPAKRGVVAPGGSGSPGPKVERATGGGRARRAPNPQLCHSRKKEGPPSYNRSRTVASLSAAAGSQEGNRTAQCASEKKKKNKYTSAEKTEPSGKQNGRERARDCGALGRWEAAASGNAKLNLNPFLAFDSGARGPRVLGARLSQLRPRCSPPATNEDGFVDSARVAGATGALRRLSARPSLASAPVPLSFAKDIPGRAKVEGRRALTPPPARRASALPRPPLLPPLRCSIVYGDGRRGGDSSARQRRSRGQAREQTLPLACSAHFRR
ncbi:hypothetical protein HPB50_003831 [Hyalomma asiaticum]|uniref:Uncharacterized protein n=1 Tax=Hyalomma asiaticum TaxID=266040 RepID=A0ACB7TEI6_HYAAI|nr:hypothetical protein HPB50_003831 [Hyalomma asiaticum]